MELAALIAEVRAAGQQRRPFDPALAAEVVRALTAPAPGSAPEWRVRRDGALRLAAAALPGTRHAKAKKLEELMKTPCDPDVGPLVRQALEADPRRKRLGYRHLLRILR